MKRILSLVAVALVALTASAQNPDALKNIKKAKTTSEAQQMINANESSMSAAENAQAYNKLVEIAYKNASDEITVLQEVEALRQMGQTSNKTVDNQLITDNLVIAYEAALACDKYDVQPNEKGKVAPKFRKSNAEKLGKYRTYLITAGQDAQQADDNKTAGDMYALYVKTGTADLFTESQPAANDQYLSEVARVASLTAYQNGDKCKAMCLANVVMQDPEKVKEGLDLKLHYIGQGLDTDEDKANALKQYEALYAEYPSDTQAFSSLYNMYGTMKQTDKQEALMSEFLAKNPQNFTAWAMKGQDAMNEQKYDDAIANYKKALSCEIEDNGLRALVCTYVGYSYTQKAADLEKYDDQLQALKDAIPYLEEARTLDPERDRSNWAYPLYSCYYHVKGEKDPATQELANMLGM